MFCTTTASGSPTPASAAPAPSGVGGSRPLFRGRCSPTGTLCAGPSTSAKRAAHRQDAARRQGAQLARGWSLGHNHQPPHSRRSNLVPSDARGAAQRPHRGPRCRAALGGPPLPAVQPTAPPARRAATGRPAGFGTRLRTPGTRRRRPRRLRRSTPSAPRRRRRRPPPPFSRPLQPYWHSLRPWPSWTCPSCRRGGAVHMSYTTGTRTLDFHPYFSG
jgi:hypothetical protein